MSNRALSARWLLPKLIHAPHPSNTKPSEEPLILSSDAEPVAPRDRGLMMFAGIWRSWSGDYGSKKEPNEGKHLLFSFLTTEPNDVVRPVHAKAMPVVLIGNEAQQEWLSAPAERIAEIQARPIPNDALDVLDAEEASAYGGAYIK